MSKRAGGQKPNNKGRATAAVRRAGGWRSYASSVALVALATSAGALARTHLALPDLVMLYLLVIMVTAALFGRGPSLVAATLSVLAYDFFFIPPFYTFNVDDERHLLTFAMMFVVGLLISGLTLRIRRHEQDARAREERTSALYDLSRDLSSTLDARQAAAVIARHAAEMFEGGAAVFLPDGGAALAPAANAGPPFPLGATEMRAVAGALGVGRQSGGGTDDGAVTRVTCVPLAAGVEPLGVLVFPSPAQALGSERRHFVDAFAHQAGVALERARLAERAEAASLRARTEEMRSALLSAVSHDLRTPLASITGAATTLREANVAVSGSPQSELLETICEEADRLERLVRNLLDMTQLESGALEVKREWVPLEEVVGSALTRLEAKLVGRAVRADLPADLPLVSVDAVLLEQVFVNLFENAAKYTPAGTALDVRARPSGQAVVVEVADRGPGLPPGGESRLFEKFFRANATGVPGAGLGLAICRGVVAAHGGTLSAENREGGGALFRLTLPLVDRPPAVPPDLEVEATLDREAS